MKESSERWTHGGSVPRWAYARPDADLLLAVACLMGAIAVYSVCLLLGGPLYGFEEPLHALATRSLRLAWALVAAVAIALLLQEGLSAEAKGWQKAVAAIVLASPYVAAALGCPFVDGVMLHAGMTRWIEVALWPPLSALLAHMLLSGGRPLGRGTALYAILCLSLIALSTCAERFQHDYAALSASSAVFAARGCGRLARLMRADVPEPGPLAVYACGIAYAACIITGLASELLNITTCVGPVRSLGTVPATILLTAAMLGRCALEEPEVLQH